jgi:hypothetical protein
MLINKESYNSRRRRPGKRTPVFGVVKPIRVQSVTLLAYMYACWLTHEAPGLLIGLELPTRIHGRQPPCVAFAFRV